MMIKNQKQAGITKGRLAELVQAKASLEANTTMSGFELQLAEDSLNSMIEDLQDQLRTYEALTSGSFHCFKPKGLREISDTIIAARLASKISQSALADRLGLKEQQIQRYEATDYETASWPRIIEVCTALGIEFNFENVHIINMDWADNFLVPDGLNGDMINAASEKVQQCDSLLIC